MTINHVYATAIIFVVKVTPQWPVYVLFVVMVKQNCPKHAFEFLFISFQTNYYIIHNILYTNLLNTLYIL